VVIFMWSFQTFIKEHCRGVTGSAICGVSGHGSVSETVTQFFDPVLLVKILSLHNFCHRRHCLFCLFTV